MSKRKIALFIILSILAFIASFIYFFLIQFGSGGRSTSCGYSYTHGCSKDINSVLTLLPGFLLITYPAFHALRFRNKLISALATVLLAIIVTSSTILVVSHKESYSYTYACPKHLSNSINTDASRCLKEVNEAYKGFPFAFVTVAEKTRTEEKHTIFRVIPFLTSTLQISAALALPVSLVVLRSQRKDSKL